MAIPNIIHFVWAGMILPEPNTDIINNWHESSPSSEIWLWTDFIGKTPEQIDRTKKSYAEKFGHIPNFKLKDIYRPDQSNPALQVMDEFSHYELVRMRPNYGSFSDVLRYRLLDEFGGGYFDSDVKHGIYNFEELVALNNGSTEHVLYIDTDSQGSNNIGNDSIVCSKGNPLIKQIYENAKNHYLYKSQPHEKSHHIALLGIFNALPQQLFLYDDNAENGYIFRSTPIRTGNVCIQLVIDKLGITNADITADSAQVRSLVGYTTHSPNFKAWVNMPIEQMEEAVALQKIKESMQFEAEKLGILRLDDHINNFVAATSEEGILAGMDKIFDYANRIDLKRVKGVQLTFENPKAVEFCNKHRLLEKTFLFPQSASCEAISSTPNYFRKAIELLFAIDLFRSLAPSANEGPASTATTIEAVLKRCVAIDLFSDVAKDYCTTLCKSNWLRSADTKSKTKMGVEAYLSFLIKHTGEILKELESVYKALDDKEVKEVIPSCQKLLTDMLSKLTDYAKENNFTIAAAPRDNANRIS